MASKRKYEGGMTGIIRPSNDNSGLLKLPGEVRNQIYGYLLEPMVTPRPQSTGNPYHIKLENGIGPRVAIPAIIHTSSQLREEFISLWAPLHTVTVSPDLKMGNLKRFGADILKNIPLVIWRAETRIIQERINRDGKKCHNCACDRLEDVEVYQQLNCSLQQTETSTVLQIGFPAQTGKLLPNNEQMLSDYLFQVTSKRQVTVVNVAAIVAKIKSFPYNDAQLHFSLPVIAVGDYSLCLRDMGGDKVLTTMRTEYNWGNAPDTVRPGTEIVIWRDKRAV